MEKTQAPVPVSCKTQVSPLKVPLFLPAVSATARTMPDSRKNSPPPSTAPHFYTWHRYPAAPVLPPWKAPHHPAAPSGMAVFQTAAPDL